MVKILKHGTKHLDQKIHVGCVHCGSHLEYLESEGKLHQDQREGSYREFLCPVCKQSITLNASRRYSPDSLRGGLGT